MGYKVRVKLGSTFGEIKMIYDIFWLTFVCCGCCLLEFHTKLLLMDGNLLSGGISTLQ